MPQALTYPGVYVQEDLSGPRPIQGIQPSITAFVGRTRRGPLGRAVTVYNFGEFVTTFGAPWDQSWLPDAVFDFFRNGGGTAVIVRAVQSLSSGGGAANRAVQAVRATAAVQAGSEKILLRAREYGGFADDWHARVIAGGINDQGQPVTTLYSVSITSVPKPGDPEDRVTFETFRNLRDTEIIAAINERSLLVSAATSTAAAPGADVRFSGGGDGAELTRADYDDVAATALEARGALHALPAVDLFSLLVIPPGRTAAVTGWNDVVAAATKIAVTRRAFLILDAPQAWSLQETEISTMNVGVFGPPSPNAAIYTPWLDKMDDAGKIFQAPPSGALAGIYARTDGESGVWKAPAGVDAGVFGALGPSRILTADQNGALNIRAINCLMRKSNWPVVVWGARTEVGFDGSGTLERYIPVRRTLLFIEETLYRNTEWVVFRENDETLWMQVKAGITAFLHGLFLQGAFQGDIPEKAYYVECGWTTMSQADIDNGIINISVGIAPVKPAEFVVLTFRHIQQTV